MGVSPPFVIEVDVPFASRPLFLKALRIENPRIVPGILLARKKIMKVRGASRADNTPNVTRSELTRAPMSVPTGSVKATMSLCLM